MNPPKFTVIPFQQPNTLQCPACSFTSTNGPAITFQQNVAAQQGTADALVIVCTRCQYGNQLEWLMATAT